MMSNSKERRSTGKKRPNKIVLTPEEMELAKRIGSRLKTEDDLNHFSRTLKKLTIEAALGAEMEEHLGYEPHSKDGHHSGNSRNGYSSKTIKGDIGQVDIEVPRDRNGEFEPQLVKKGQTRLTQFDSQILFLYAKGMSTRDIVDSFYEIYGAEISPMLVSRVTDAVIEQVTEWQARPLDKMYPIVYLDCIVVKVRQDKKVINKSIYLALGINMHGQKELLGLWISENEGAKFWLGILTELQNRGLEDVIIACVDGLTGFADAIEAVYPKTKVQLCIVHQIRNSLRYVNWKDRKKVAADLKQIYCSTTVEAAEQELAALGGKWDAKYPMVAKSWRRNWANLITLFEYPENIRKAIYTTNAIESLNSVIRKSTKTRKIFPTDAAAMKVIFLATQHASKKWTMPIRNWASALNRFMIEYPDRMPDKV